VDKKTVAQILEEIGTFMELKGENPFKVRAFTGAARTIETLDGDLAALVESGEIANLKGVGPATREVVTQLMTTGTSAVYEELKAGIEPGLIEMLEIPGLGPKKIKAIHEGLGITSVGELEYACMENRLATLTGFGAKTQEKILKGIALRKAFRGRHLYVDALPVAETILALLEGHADVIRVALAGSMRRRMETVKDLDFVVSSDHPERVMADFVALPDVSEVIAHGPSKSSIRFTSGLQIDLRVVTDAQFPFTLHHFTGSKDHNEAMRSRAKGLGLKINEYGLFRGEELIPCADEAAFFQALGLDYIPPELREGLDEIALAEQHALPDLVTADQIQGVFHVHSTYSDGAASVERMALEAKSLGYRYLGISDHSQAAAYAHGLTVDRIREQHAEIDALNARMEGFTVLKGIEADILADGSIDYDDATLEAFDFVIASIHQRFGMDEAAMTERLVKAIRHPRVTMLGHMTGRLLLAREPYDLDLERVFKEAAEHGVIIELNANPHRLDIDWRHLRRALALGVRISINPDAHSVDGLKDVRIGVGIARKGGATAAQVFNTQSLEDILTHLARRRALCASV
jgi:DNA polymerase (family 10)